MPQSAFARMRLTGALAVALVMPIGAANAQHTVRILTPTSDSCRAFLQALSTKDKVTLTVLASWALGFMSGMADGSGIDFLHDVSPDALYQQLTIDCGQNTRQPFSAAVNTLARSLIAGSRH
jgi:hypothetical protein